MELKDLILQSDSFTSDEDKQYWIDLIPSMNETHKRHLTNMLLKEISENKRLDEKYWNYTKNTMSKKEMVNYINS